MYQHYLILPLVFAQLFSFGHPCGCPNGWSDLLGSGGNNCENIFPDQNLTWNDAQKFCNQFGSTVCMDIGNLAILEYADINQLYGNYVLNKTGGNLTEWWAGATTQFNGGNWTWNGWGIAFGYRNFAPGQLCPFGSTDCCATVTLPYFKWNIRNCNESRFPFLCEWEYAGI